MIPVVININTDKLGIELINKVSDGVGEILKPWQMVRIAKAEVVVRKIKSIGDQDTEEMLYDRAFKRLSTEEKVRQKNIESITHKAIPLLKEGARPYEIDNDWLTYFFNSARLISDDKIQDLWSRILAGEANLPGEYSKRTISQLSTFDKKDADSFLNLCNFVCDIDVPMPLILDYHHEVYSNNGLNFEILTHLQTIGLISFDPTSSLINRETPNTFGLIYHNESITLKLPENLNNALKIGSVIFTDSGKQLFSICKKKKIEGYLDYILNEWQGNGIMVISRTK